MSKFSAIKAEEDGYVFDSRAEMRRYRDLKLWVAAGEISDLQVHVEFPIKVNDQLVCKYEADFTYTENGKKVVEDVKSAPTKTRLYLLKKKLMRIVNGIEISEVMA